MGRDNERISGVDSKECHELTKGEHDLTCTICCATSDDPAKLCAPTSFSGGLFCKDLSGN